MRRSAVLAWVVAAFLAAVAGVAGLRLAAVSADLRAVERRVAALESSARTSATADDEVARLDRELAGLRDRVTDVEAAAETVCVERVVDAERARLNGANEGSNYESTVYYSTLIGIIDTVCGSPD